MVRKQIVKNAIQCKHCLEIIESVSLYDTKNCTCGIVGIDGGKDYLQIHGSLNDYVELSELSG